ncbi:phosphonopyruvate decarboxylase [Bradyrhizobium sp. 83012]|uniref:Phosphonopyruvate decarboxylase n=1 Tax=Bradyrhizobium aeschynomenes TaxID=2734909 RepID=A0ABX2CF64_9BRAD|nr:phosphonopyruvate decarboxylase [Bradyrhizobium aeschynomenes]NPU66310.1 phosphonopyruvate decarboxylase [Bradyrhizobium aeschynomenes]NPV20022.1 phosphonopyruvate decarboxylase [Bradyrhizobium aeschynomenes]
MSVPTNVLLSRLSAAGYTFFSGVPCSHFADLFERATESALTDVAAANEGSAVALAAGAALSGQRAVVALQNSGLGHVVNPLTSLLMVNRIPVLLLISVRGHPDESADEPQHVFMGAATKAILDQLAIDWCEFDGTTGGLDQLLIRAAEAHRQDAPFAVLLRKGQLAQSSAGPACDVPLDYPLSAGEAIELIGQRLDPATLIISTTGFITRELFRINDRPENFYMQGSLGHCSALAAGLAIAMPERPVLALDGDGGALMHMGVMSTIGHTKPQNLIHVVLDNESYASTGGQASTSRSSSLDLVASACGYRSAVRCVEAEHILTAMEHCASTPGPHFLLCKINRSHPATLPRVTTRHTPVGNKRRFQDAIQDAMERDVLEPSIAGQRGTM